MTTSIKISVNGNYKLPVSYSHEGNEYSLVISGRGHDGPHEHTIHLPHGSDAMKLTVGPESPDNANVTAADESGGGGHEKPPAVDGGGS